jgi:hypothetical protein
MGIILRAEKKRPGKMQQNEDIFMWIMYMIGFFKRQSIYQFRYSSRKILFVFWVSMKNRDFFDLYDKKPIFLAYNLIAFFFMGNIQIYAKVKLFWGRSTWEKKGVSACWNLKVTQHLFNWKHPATKSQGPTLTQKMWYITHPHAHTHTFTPIYVGVRMYIFPSEYWP